MLEHLVDVGLGVGLRRQDLLLVDLVAVEQLDALSQAAGLGNVAVRIGDGTLGWPAEAPFDAIVVRRADPWCPAR